MTKGCFIVSIEGGGRRESSPSGSGLAFGISSVYPSCPSDGGRPMSSGAKLGAGKLGRGDGAFDLASYAPVAERITLFYETFPRGRIITELVSRTEKDVVFRALVYRDASDGDAAATGWAAEREGDGEINTVACLENTETSAIGRALANLGFTASTRRPSREEMDKAARERARLGKRPAIVAEPAPAPAPRPSIDADPL